MAVLVDLDSEPPEGHHAGTNSDPRHVYAPGTSNGAVPTRSCEPSRSVTVPHPLGKILSIYPIAVNVAAYCDLTDLDSLSRTCRAAHDGLFQYRRALLNCTLRCNQDPLPVNPKDTFRYRARASNWSLSDNPRLSNFNGKAGQCARDMVSECRRCSTVICRNCAIKQPQPRTLTERVRRLCDACAHAPIATLVNPKLDPETPITSSIIQQALCSCDTKGVWLCQPCGRTIRNQDQSYQRIWHWRLRFLDVGVTGSDRGVTCARQARCLAAVEREVEVDGGPKRQPPPSSQAGPPAPDAPAAPPAPGYDVHELDRPRGLVLSKTVVKVKVGGTVPEWPDELARRQFLGREVEGKVRRWCGWCSRVLPGEAELQASVDAALGRGVGRGHFEGALPLRIRGERQEDQAMDT